MSKARARIGIPKIAGFVAAGADKALYLYQRRRNETFVVLHHLGNDGDERLEVGARFTGRFYPSRCDLSADGEHFVYFVMGGAQQKSEKRLYCWTAMCRPPKLTALFLLPHHDTWGGGGTFHGNAFVTVVAGMHNTGEELEAVHKRRFDGVTVNVHSSDLKIPPIRNLPPKRSRWKKAGLPFSTKFTTKTKHARLTIERRGDADKKGDFDSWQYGLTDHHGHSLLPEKTVEQFTWADFDNRGRLLASIGSAVVVF